MRPRCAITATRPRDQGEGPLLASASERTIRAGLRGPALLNGLVDLLGASKVLGTREDLIIYEYDGAVDTATPDAVVLPNDTADVAKLARFCHQHGIPIVPRGAATGLSGGAIPVEGGVVVSFARMARILEIDVANRRAVVQPGLINLHLSTAAARTVCTSCRIRRARRRARSAVTSPRTPAVRTPSRTV